MPDKDAIEDAWKVHSAITDWTGKVDAKAAFILTIESAVVAAVIVGRAEGHQLEFLVGIWRGIVLSAGLLALGVSVVLAAMVVVPNIRRSKVSTESSSNWIFFGHLKDWDPTDLADKLRNDDLLPVLSRQLVRMSQIAWTKHVRVQWSFTIALLGSALVLVAALVP